MHPCAGDSFEWIQNGREEVLRRDRPDWKCSVSNLIPKQFEACAKVLHQIDANYENIDNPRSHSSSLYRWWRMNKVQFEAELIEGHKKVMVVLVPFDPELVGLTATPPPPLIGTSAAIVGPKPPAEPVKR